MVYELAINVDGTGNAPEFIDSVTDKLGGLGKFAAGIGGVAVGALAAVGTAAAGATALAFDTAQDIQSGQRDIQRSLGDTANAATDYKAVMTDAFGANLGDDMADIAETIIEVEQITARLGKTSESTLSGMVQGAERVQATFGTDTGETISAATALMENFGLTSVQAMDFVVKGQQLGLNSAGDYLDTITEYAPQFSAAEASAGQFFSALETGVQGGVLGTDKIADAFKEFRVRILDGSKLTSESLKSLGFNTEEFLADVADGTIPVVDAFEMVNERLLATDDLVKQNEAGVGLLGTQFEDLGIDAIRNLDLSKTSLEDMIGATDGLTVGMNTLGEVGQGAWRQLELALEPFGTAILDIVNDNIPLLQTGINRVAQEIGTLAVKGAEVLEAFAQGVDAGGFSQGVIEAVRVVDEELGAGLQSISDDPYPIAFDTSTAKGQLLELVQRGEAARGAFNTGLEEGGFLNGILEGLKAFSPVLTHAILRAQAIKKAFNTGLAEGNLFTGALAALTEFEPRLNGLITTVEKGYDFVINLDIATAEQGLIDWLNRTAASVKNVFAGGPAIEGPQLPTFQGNIDQTFGANFEWPEPPLFEWPEFPEFNVEWPKFPEFDFTWPELATVLAPLTAFTWPVMAPILAPLLAFKWPDIGGKLATLLDFKWPEFPSLDFEWPSVDSEVAKLTSFSWPSVSGIVAALTAPVALLSNLNPFGGGAAAPAATAAPTSATASVTDVDFNAFTHDYKVTATVFTDPDFGDFTHDYVSTSTVEGVNFGDFTNDYPTSAHIASDPDWGPYSHSYPATASIGGVNWNDGLFSHTYRATAQVTQFVTQVVSGAQARHSGTEFDSGGLRIIGDGGPEIVQAPTGTRVFNASRTRELRREMGGGNGPITIVINESSTPRETASAVQSVLQRARAKGIR